jgi:hypothetical protein
MDEEFTELYESAKDVYMYCHVTSDPKFEELLARLGAALDIEGE